jgi:hypothetical protein
MDQVVFMEGGDGLTAVMQRPFFAESYQLFRHRPGRFGPGDGGADPLVTDQRPDQVRQHAVAMLGSPAELNGST